MCPRTASSFNVCLFIPLLSPITLSVKDIYDLLLKQFITSSSPYVCVWCMCAYVNICQCVCVRTCMQVWMQILFPHLFYLCQAFSISHLPYIIPMILFKCSNFIIYYIAPLLSFCTVTYHLLFLSPFPEIHSFHPPHHLCSIHYIHLHL